MELTQQQEKRLNIVFEESNLSKEEKKLWIKWFKDMPEEAIEAVLDLFEILPGEIKWLTDLQLRKENALSLKDHGEWNRIVEEEKKYLSKLSD